MMSKEPLTGHEIASRFRELLEGKKYSPQNRGFQLENLIYSILENENLEPRSGYKPDGEQIDGSFFWNGQTFLLEAKWVEKKIPVSSIYSFKGKLDGKFHTTSGVFISIGGYSDDVEDALKFGKSLNILLFDSNDMTLIFNGNVSFAEVLKFKLRQAGDTGSLWVPYDLKEKAEKISETLPTEILKFAEFINSPQKPTVVDDLLVFVEGSSDVPVVRNLIEPIRNLYSLSYRIETLKGAMNIRQLPSLINLYGDLKKTKGVIVILDDDQMSSTMFDVIQNIEKQLENSSIYVRTLFLFVSVQLKDKLSKSLQIGNLKGEQIFEQLEVFVNQIAEDYYDPETDIPRATLEAAMERLSFNYDEGTLEGTDEEHGMPYTIDDLESLIQHLDDEIGRALNAVMPLDWLKNADFDYRYTIQEFLSENYYDRIDKLGWDATNL